MEPNQTTNQSTAVTITPSITAMTPAISSSTTPAAPLTVAEDTRIILVTSRKGGTGKTTLSMHVAAGLHRRGKRVLLVDADPQSSATHWAGQPESDIEFPTINLSEMGAGIAKEIRKHVRNYEYIVIDGRPSIEHDVIGVLLLSADLVLIPLRASALDYQATLQMLKSVDVARAMNEDLKAALVLNQTEERRILARSVTQAIVEQGITLLQTRVGPRECFPHAFSFGSTVYQMNTRPARLAAAEIDGVVDEITSMLS
ncbi:MULTISPECIES: ParA family partition ATPase [unclassified Burkholderia]|uniref:ParA family partition ATPase n=1 Tax=unclassified Burkholderia TaxID=2613784 RepID=UPI002AB1B933|nr:MULTISPECIES: ParA family partition ATPase [unclassified Burkholderia]